MIFMVLLYAVTTVAFFLYFGFAIEKSMHMFQLNSYHAATHIRWLIKNGRSMIPSLVGTAVTIALLISGISPVLTFSVMTVVYAALAVTQRPRKAKKPLVYTKRVIRMLVTISLLVLILICAACYALTPCGTMYMIVVAVLTAMLPLFVIVANFINKPVEYAVNQYYINDAKKILKSCPELLTIGVTGSFGKTSVKYILHTLLQAEYDVLKTPESYNTPMGVVKTIRSMLRATHQIFVCEMGARQVGDIKELCDIAAPKMGIITSVGLQHLETFHSLENVKRTKFELADALPPDGTIFLNLEDVNIRSFLGHVKNHMVSYGLSDTCDYYATNISASAKGTTFTVYTPQLDSAVFTTKMVGAHNVINIVGAIAICCELGIPLLRLKGQVRKLESVPHRLQLIRRNGITLIDDSFNSNPTGANAAIDALALFDGCKILVTPGMVELGEKQDELNHAFGTYAARVCDYVMLVGKKQTQSIYEGLLLAGYPKDKIFVVDGLQEALSKAYGVNGEGREKIILLENDLPDNF